MSGMVVRGRSIAAVLLFLPVAAAAQSVPAAQGPATPLPPARNGVITPRSGSGVDPHMPVMHPKLPGRMPVIRPPGRSTGGRTVIDPR